MSVCILFIIPYKYAEIMHTGARIGVATPGTTFMNTESVVSVSDVKLR
jgi:hypothetical protein